MQTTTRSLRHVRLAARAPRLVAGLLVAILALAGLRVIVTGPPAAPAAPPPAPATAPDDSAVRAFAEGFAREYLTWEPRGWDERAARLRPYVGTGIDDDAGLRPGGDSVQRVTWTSVSAVRRTDAGTNVVVAAETSNGRLHLSVPVGRAPNGFLGLSGYPALVGPPPVDGRGAASPPTTAIEDDDLAAIVERAVTNYLAGERDNLLADLTPDAVVSLPEKRLRVTSVDDLAWVRPGHSVALELEAQDAAGSSWTLRYVLDVRRSDRWYVRTLHLDPTTGGK
jgi:conjugative transposon protein TcpC